MKEKESHENVSLKSIFNNLMIERVPNYGNKFFYSLGFLSMICFCLLVLTGLIMAFFGPLWWITNSVGRFFRSIHLWSTQAFILFIILHLLIVFFTSGFRKPRRLTWALGALMLFFVMAESEFGYALRGDFSSQWRSLQGADLYNGSGIGIALNSLNYQQVYGIHLVLVPIGLLILLFCHYLLVRVLGIAKPYREDIPYEVVPANHSMLFLRGGILIAALIILAFIFPSPFVASTTIKEIAQKDPAVLSATLAKEFNKTSDTATYVDNIAPYTFDTRKVYIDAPYSQMTASDNSKNLLQDYDREPKSLQDEQLKAASDYFAGNQKPSPDLKNPVVAVITSLIPMAQSGEYESVLSGENTTGDRSTYVTRFLSDTGVMDDKAQALGITTDQYGMLREESSRFPFGAWWLAPVGLLDHTVLANDDNQDRDGAIILGILVLLLIIFPYIPYLNRLPDKIKAYKLVWRDNK